MPRIFNSSKASLVGHVVALIRSPSIAGYLVGITKDVPGRKASYIREGFPLFFIIKTELLAAEAVELEKYLFETLTENKRLIQYKKYQSSKRDRGHRRGMGKSPGTERNFVLYVAAWPKN